MDTVRVIQTQSPAAVLKQHADRKKKQRGKRAIDENKDLVLPNISLDVALISTLYCKPPGIKIQMSHINVIKIIHSATKTYMA